MKKLLVSCTASQRERGPKSNPDLPELKASVGAFTRLWLGVRPATGLVVTDDLHGSPELLAQLDQVVRVPVPAPWARG